MGLTLRDDRAGQRGSEAQLHVEHPAVQQGAVAGHGRDGGRPERGHDHMTPAMAAAPALAIATRFSQRTSRLLVATSRCEAPSLWRYVASESPESVAARPPAPSAKSKRSPRAVST